MREPHLEKANDRPALRGHRRPAGEPSRSRRGRARWARSSFVATVWVYVGSFTLPLPVALAVGGFLPVLAIVGYSIRSPKAAALALFCSLVALGSLVLAVGVAMPGLLAGVLVYLLLGRVAPSLHAGAPWLRAGVMTPRIGMLIALTSTVSSMALVAWYWILRPDVREFLLFPGWIPGWALPLVVLAFSMLNAAAEEAVFRGAVLHALDAALGAGWISIVIQAAAFGVWHIHGFPKGLLGCAMAFVFALMLGFIRRHTGGLLAVWITHLLADVVILGILLQLT